MKKLYPILFILLLLFSNALTGQNFLKLDECSFEEYEINDHQDSDNDGDVCEAKLTLTKTAFYTEDEPCTLSTIKWDVKVDLWKDGTFDIEYSSELPPSDNTLDDTNGNGIPDLYIPRTSNNEEQTINLPDIGGQLSQHEVTWLVSDDCDLGDLCKASFYVIDKKAPTPYCVSGFTLIYDGTPFDILAQDLDLGSFDNCTAQEELRFSFSGDEVLPMYTITCDDVLNSPVELRMYAWDNNDNADYCTVYLTVIPGPTTDCYPENTIFGNVSSWRGDPMVGVEVKLDAELPGFPMTTQTDAEGNYDFGLMPDGMSYTLTASLDEAYNPGLSTLDLVLIQRHILGIQSFATPYQIIAGDVNGDKKLSASDLLSHRKLILGVISEFPFTPSWQFLYSDYDFVDPINPFPDLSLMNNDLFTIVFNQIDPAGYNFTGLKTGDVNE